MQSIAINTLDDCNALAQKPTIIISACLLGHAVRYDGKSKKQNHLALLEHYCNVKSICPEAESGLGIPRPPVRLISTDNGIEAIGVKDNTLNVTQALQSFSNNALSNTQATAFILKARSPSCGINNTPIYNQQDKELAKGSGLFAATAQKNLPHALFFDEAVFESVESLSQCVISCYQQLLQ